MNIDQFITSFCLNANHPKWLDFISEILNRLGKGDSLAFILISLAICGYFLGKRLWVKAAWGGICTISVAGILVQLLKHLFGRARPKMDLGAWHWIGPNFFKSGFDSFPSGHAMATFSFAAFLSFYFPRLRFVLYGFALSVALLGRVWSAHHFFLDVLVGGALGALLGHLFAKLFKVWTLREKPQPTIYRDLFFYRNRWMENKTRLRDLALILFVCGGTLFAGLGSSALWDRDETEYAQAVIEMRQNKEWLIPTLEGKPFIEKPILLYWITRANTMFLGENEWGFRIGSAVAATIVCFLTYGLGKVLFGSLAGLWAALLLSSSFLFVGGNRLLMTDPFLVMFTLAAFLVYRAAKSRWLGVLTAGFFLGFAVLSKGPIALFPVPVIFLWELYRRKDSEFSFAQIFCRCLAMSVLALTIAAPWFIYSFKAQAQATSTFFLYDNLARFSQGMEGHTGPAFYHLPVLLLGFLPWTFLVVAGIVEEWRTRSVYGLGNSQRLLIIWSVFMFVFFSLSAFKLPHYMLVIMPAIAIFTGNFLSQLWQNQTNLEVRWVFGGNWIVSFILFLASLSLYWIRPEYFCWKVWIPFLLFTLVMFIAWRYTHHFKIRNAMRLTVFGSLLLFTSIIFFTLPHVESLRPAKMIGEKIAMLPRSTPVAGYYFSEPSLFIYGRRIFPKIEDKSLDNLLQIKNQVIVITNKRLKQSSPKVAYKVLAQKRGFVENNGELTLLLITADSVKK